MLTETDPEFQPIKTGELPHIIGPFTDWRYCSMRAVAPFCKQYDRDPPDFLPLAIEQGLVRPNCAEGHPNKIPMNLVEKAKVEEVALEHYRANWSKLILKYLLFQNPNIANAQSMSSLSLKHKPNEQIYFHVAWLKPGRNTYVVEQMSGTQDTSACRGEDLLREEGVEDENEHIYDLLDMLEHSQASKNRIIGPDRKSLKILAKRSNLNRRNFYVHQMLTGFRSEIVP